MRTTTKITALLLVVIMLFTGCGNQPANNVGAGTNNITNTPNNSDIINDNTPTGTTTPDAGNDSSKPDAPGSVVNPGSSDKPNPGSSDVTVPDLGDSDETFGDDLSDSDIYNGQFEADIQDVTINCLEGTSGAYKIEGSTLTFTEINADSVYSISGQFKGNIVIDVVGDYKFDLEMHGFSLVSDSQNPITILSGDEISITAKKEYQNYIYDNREAVDSEDESVYSAAIYSLVDLEICGKGELSVVSENNNGIHSKDDLTVKNLTLTVKCTDNALKGNDSITVENGCTTLIATQGDGMKTTNSDISDKGNQRGTITIIGGEHTIYAACDGIDAAYNAVVDDSSTVLNINTDKYSNYSKEVTVVKEDIYYIRFTSNSYKYSVKYYNSDEDYLWVNAEYHSSVSGGRTNYYYYSFPKNSAYSKMQFFIYSSDMEQGQATNYLVASDYLTPHTSYDTFALTSSGSSLRYSWTNYTTSIQGGFGGPGGWGGGPGGMQEGNKDKGDYSTKGIKASNEIHITAGTIVIKAYDDAIHANNDSTLENGASPTGNVYINSGVVSVYSNDDGIHADGRLTISDGTVSVSNSYEGLEGTTIEIAGGNVSVVSSDDGLNATATSNTGVTISGGTLYVYAGGDGIDANSRTSYSGIVFSGGNTVVISTSGGNSAIDTEQGYKYTGGSVLAIMPSGGMTSESTHCSNFSSIATSKSISLQSGSYLTVTVDGNTVTTVKMPRALSGRVIYLGSSAATIASATTSDATLDGNGVCWE